ncbi:hypothetical protein RND71_012355 [Anisodus tanguticus]|uniref:Ion transport domain-containing protein n=1 Tax=Anisodus tanguticus TaxID=243964 RepID=A0AAE1SD29_9SOLA|nr:hypothetical protein RND71_012355 [Anisodus tanguticus]
MILSSYSISWMLLVTLRGLVKLLSCDQEVMGSSRGNKLWQKCKINLDEFARLCNVIALKFEEKDSMSIVEKFPKFYHSPASKKLRDFIRSPTFEYIIVFILLVNFVAVIVETMLDVQNNSAQIFWQKAENIFVTEEITTLVGPHGLTFMSNGNWIRYLLIGRMLRFIRLLMHIERFHAFVTTFLPSYIVCCHTWGPYSVSYASTALLVYRSSGGLSTWETPSYTRLILLVMSFLLSVVNSLQSLYKSFFLTNNEEATLFSCHDYLLRTIYIII